MIHRLTRAFRVIVIYQHAADLVLVDCVGVVVVQGRHVVAGTSSAHREREEKNVEGKFEVRFREFAIVWKFYQLFL